MLEALHSDIVPRLLRDVPGQPTDEQRQADPYLSRFVIIGEVVSMKLAEMGSWIGSRSEGLWVREIRKLTASGHQTSLLSTAYGLLGLENAASLFSRWSQENFFRYMMEHVSG